MLALQLNRTVSTDRLIEGLWGERAPASAAKLVQLYVSQLRKLFGEEAEIVTRGRGYELRLGADQVDAARFESLVADGDAREALALWRGPALADVADEPFAAAEIRRLEELRLRATELAIDDDLAAGRHRELIGELDALVAEHPLSERLHAQRMLALYRSGRQAEALAAYRQAREVLVEEVGVEPGPELRRRHEAILHHDPALLGPPAAAEPAAAAIERRGRRRRPRVFAAVAALALLGGLAVFAVSRWTAPTSLPRIDENEVGRIDPGTSRIRAEYPVGREPRALAAGGGSMWSIDGLDGTVSRIEKDRVVPIAAGDDPVGLAFAAGSLWVSDQQHARVWQVSPVTNRVVGGIKVGNAPGAVAAGFGSLWVASQVDPTITRLDLATGTRKRIGLASIPTAIAAGAGAVWVASEEGGTVFRIDPRSGEVEKPIAVGNGPVGVAVGENAVWVVNRQDATVMQIDPTTDAVTGLTRVGRDPSAIAAGDGGVWVADGGAATVTRIDPATRRPAAPIAVRSSPTAIAVADGSVWTAVDAAPASHRGGTLRVETQFFFAPDPQDDPMGPASLVYDGLVSYRRAGGPTFGTLVGDLATDVPDPSPDGRTYVFRLRPGIRYSNGEPLRPEDFRASMEALFRHHPGDAPPDPYLRIKGVPACVANPSRCDLSRGIVADARARTITLHLTGPDPDLLPYLSAPLAYVAPADHPFGHSAFPPGTGPYRVASFHLKRGARLVRNPGFRAWAPDDRPTGYADVIEFRLVPMVEKQVAAVRGGRADVAVVGSPFGGPLAPARLQALRTAAAGRLYSSAAPEVDFMFLNTRTAPFDDVRVRRALNYAVDRRALA
ncbi:MAG TPA: ABC transporter substrate-binding protein, partial [Solirubrobacteraceae bacterium]